MLSKIWLGMILIGGAYGILKGEGSAVLQAAIAAAEAAVKNGLQLAGILAFWLGVMEVAQRSGLVEKMAKACRPLLVKLFPSLPPDHPALGSILLNLTANFLGMGNAATPFGLKAMEQMDQLAGHTGTASDAMCTFLALNAAGLTIIPTTVLGLRLAQGSQWPAAFLLPMVLTGLTGTIAALIIDRLLRRSKKGW